MTQQTNSTQNTGAPKISQDMEKLQLQEMVQDYMNSQDISKKIRSMINGTNNNTSKTRFNINMDEMRHFNPRLNQMVLKDPLLALKMFEEQLNTQVKGMIEEGGASGKGMSNEKMAVSTDFHFPKKVAMYHVNFDGNFGQNHVTPRGLKADLLNNFVAVNGIVTKMSIVKPHIQTSIHYCEETKKGHIKQYNDKHNLGQLQAETEDGYTAAADSNNFPTQDAQGNALSTEYGYCLYKDYQTLTIQEMPERAPTGQLPRSIQVILENDLVDKCKPGDRVQITGVFRASYGNTYGSAIAQTQLIATGVQSLNHEREKPNLNETDIKNIKKISKEKNVFDVLGNSIASSLEGMLNVKKAALLQLLGGAEKNLENGTHLRGDINLLMVGDPSTAKSQLIRHIMDIAPLAINTTGRGSTGVGLTAAITMDKDTGEKHLEAGAMVLADRGIVCIDEFDKMNDADRVAIHEVMEQQTVTIAKAGIHVSLNARCSVTAAANPIYGEYARDQSVARNIGMPDSLLSRFDLLFVMLDEKDADSDRRIAERVIANHRYQSLAGNNEQCYNYFNDDTVIEPELDDKKNAESKSSNQVYQKASGKKDELQIVTRDFLKKYISYAKAQKAPELHQDCVEYAATFYSMIRAKALNYDPNKISVPITVRTLETMIRLATAHAKLRLSKAVEPSDIEIAIEMLNQSIFQEETDKKVAEEENPESEDEEMYDEKENDNVVANKNAGLTREQRYAQRHGEDIVMQSEQTKKPQQKSPIQKKTKEVLPVKITKTKVAFKSVIEEEEEELIRRPTKRLKMSHISPAKEDTTATEAVAQLFQAPVAQVQAEQVDMIMKKLVYKMMTEIKDVQQKSSIDQLWKSYMTAPDSETMKRGKSIVQNKSHLVQIVEALEQDNLVMYSNDDGSVLLI